MATATPQSYSVASGETVYGGRLAPVNFGSPYELTAASRGSYTVGSAPNAVYRNGATYLAWTDAGGDSGISKYTHATDTVEHFTLSTNGGATQNNHNSPTIQFRDDGRILAVWSLHNVANLRRCISTNPEDISAWGAETQVATSTFTSYNIVHKLSQTGKFYYTIRLGTGSSAGTTRPIAVLATADGVTWDAQQTWISIATHQSYWKTASNGVDRIDFVYQSNIVGEGPCDLRHAYMKLDGSNAPLFYASDDVLIGSPPIGITGSTLVKSGGTNLEHWPNDVTYGPDGRVWALSVQFLGGSPKNERYWFHKWTGSAWESYQIMDPGTAPTSDTYSQGGSSFDPYDPTIVYLSARGASRYEIQAWRTEDMGETWSKVADITTGTTSPTHHMSPICPVDNDGRAAVVWQDGSITNFTSASQGYSAVERI